MATLAGTLGLEGRYQDSEEIFQHIISIQERVLGAEHPETAESEYNLACIQAHEGKRDEALGRLAHALDHGLSPATALAMDQDPDLASLHGDPRYQALLEHAKERVAAERKPK